MKIFLFFDGHPQYERLIQILPPALRSQWSEITWISLPVTSPIRFSPEKTARLQYQLSDYLRGQGCSANNYGPVRIDKMLDQGLYLISRQFAHLFEHTCLNLIDRLVMPRSLNYDLHGHVLVEKATQVKPAVIFNACFDIPKLSLYLTETWSMLQSAVLEDKDVPPHDHFLKYLIEKESFIPKPISVEEIVTLYHQPELYLS